MAIRRSDYENYDYRDFWKNDKRLYEDRSERIAIRRFLSRLEEYDRVFFDIGCGYGRLFGEYMNFNTIILIDYSLRNLKNARDRIKKFLKSDNKKFNTVYFVAADASNLPIKTACADIVLTVRVVHHLDYPEKYFDEVTRILKKGGLYILEFANKRNLKNILRYIAGKMDTSPFNLIPSQVGETILNYHPKYITEMLTSRGFSIKKLISASNFRLEFLKRYLSINLLLFLEKMYQRFFSFTALGPSIFLESILDKKINNKCLTDFNKKIKKINRDSKIKIEDILICPYCKEDVLIFHRHSTVCRKCERRFPIEEGIYNFKI